MSNIQITGGSEKQNNWATKIAQDWISKLDAEIENQKARPESDGMSKYVAILEKNREEMIANFAKVTAKQIIYLFTAKRDIAQAMIEKSRKELN